MIKFPPAQARPLSALILLSGWLLSAPCAAPAAPAPRAVWMWEKDSYAIAQSTAAAEAAIAFLKSKDIQTVYLYADAYQGRNLIKSRPQLYRGLIGRLHGSGLRVYALLGSWYLHTEEYILPKRHKAALKMFRQVLKYNASSDAGERFDGINLDLEPHMLDQWKDRKNELLLNFLDLGKELMALKKRSGQTLAAGPAIPFWLDGMPLEWGGSRKPASEHVQDIYDYVALMDYRDHAEGRDGIISHAGDELKYAGPRGRKVVIGVETTPNEIQKVSFNHLAEPDLERELALAEKAFGAEPAFAGFAIHHFRGYLDWLEKNGSKTEKAAP